MDEDIKVKIENCTDEEFSTKASETVTVKIESDADTDEEHEKSDDDVKVNFPEHGSCFEIPEEDEFSDEGDECENIVEDPLATFKCDKCESQFMTEKNLANHIRIIHPFEGKVRRVKCPFCYYMDLPCFLQSHVRSRHPDKKIDIYPCKLCPQKFITNHHLNNHIAQEHSYSNTYLLAGLQEKISVPLKGDVVVAGEKRIYKCVNCPEWPGASSSGLRHHRRRIHPTTENDRMVNERQRERDKLFQRRKREEMIKNGQKSGKITRKPRSETQPRQEEDGSYNCDICEMTFESGRDLTSHNRKHIRFNCTEPDCSKSYTTKKLLESHINGDHKGDKPFKCELCDNKCYATKVQLNRHLKLSHSDPREKKFACQHCDLKFVTNALLKNHMRKHTGEKAFICEKCGKGFNEKKHLTEHIIFKHRYDEDVQEKYWRQEQD